MTYVLAFAVYVVVALGGGAMLRLKIYCMVVLAAVALAGVVLAIVWLSSAAGTSAVLFVILALDIWVIAETAYQVCAG